TYTLPEVAFTSLIIYDVSGRPVASLIQDWQPAGSHSAVFDGSELSSGIYLARLTARGFSQMQKLVLLK
ncbi:MAG TPA: T9SS type A sorting domain-containing protein, partial [bacterium]